MEFSATKLISNKLDSLGKLGLGEEPIDITSLVFSFPAGIALGVGAAYLIEKRASKFRLYTENRTVAALALLVTGAITWLVAPPLNSPNPELEFAVRTLAIGLTTLATINLLIGNSTKQPLT